MKVLLTITMLIFSIGICSAEVYVQGHYKSNGTYVQPYYRTRPNNDLTDNYSYRKPSSSYYQMQKPSTTWVPKTNDPFNSHKSTRTGFNSIWY